MLVDGHLEDPAERSVVAADRRRGEDVGDKGIGTHTTRSSEQLPGARRGASQYARVAGLRPRTPTRFRPRPILRNIAAPPGRCEPRGTDGGLAVNPVARFPTLL